MTTTTNSHWNALFFPGDLSRAALRRRANASAVRIFGQSFRWTRLSRTDEGEWKVEMVWWD